MSTVLTGPVQIASQTLHSSSSDKLHMLGETVFSNDGRAFRYCLVGATSLVAGNVYQASAEDTNLQNLTAVAASVGDYAVAASTTVTVDANEYAEGFAMISVTPGVGRAYKVKGHTAYSGAAPTFNTFDKVEVALTTTSRIDMVRNPYFKVIVAPTTITSAVVGAAVHPVTNGQYGWLQVSGIANLEAQNAVTVGLPVVASNDDAGTVETITDGAHELLQRVGTALTGIADGEFGAVYIDLL